jgi:YggT family protein
MPLSLRVLAIARYTVAAAFLLACLIALVSWAVRQRKLSAFGGIARFTRRVADPILKRIERTVVRHGGNPQDAPLWLIGIVLVVGLLFLGLIKWIIGVVLYVSLLEQGGPRAWISFVIDVTYFVLTSALLIRVLGSWVGMGRYNRWTRWSYRLTDWVVEPIRRVLPPLGFIDVSPLVAWFALWLIRNLIVGNLFHV